MVGLRARAVLRAGAAAAVLGGSLILGGPQPAASAPPVIKTIPVPSNPQLVTVDSTVGTVYATQIGQGRVFFIDALAGVVTRTLSSTAAYAVGVDDRTHLLYVASYEANQVTLFDGITGAPRGTVTVGPLNPALRGIAVDPVRHVAYVTSFNANAVYVVSGASRSVIRTIPVAANPSGIAVDPSTSRVYVTNQGADTVSTIDGVSGAVVRSTFVGFGFRPSAVAVDPSSQKVWVVNRSNNSVSTMDATTGVLTGRFPFTSTPGMVAVDPATSAAYVGRSDGTVAVIEGATVSSVAVPTPSGIAVDPPRRQVFVANTGPSTLTVLAAPPPRTAVTAPPTSATLRQPASAPAAPSTPAAGVTSTSAPVPAVVPTMPAPAAPTTTVPAPATGSAPPASASGSRAGRSGAGPDQDGRPVDVATGFISSVPSPTAGEPLRELADDAFLAVLLLSLLSLPVTIVNSTAETNANVIATMASRLGRRLHLAAIGRRSQQVPVAGAVVVASLVSALLYGFLQPTFGLDRSSLALLVGVALALLVLNGMERVGQVVYLTRAHRIGASLHLFPGFAAVALACVVLSRMTGLQPGLLLGPLLTVRVSQQVDRGLRGRALFLVFTGVAVVATAAWVTRSDVMDLAGPPGSFGARVIGVTWTTVIVSGVLAVAFNMVPLTFLAGAKVLAWSKPAWAGLAAFGALGFAHLVLRPAAAPGSLARRTTYLLCLLLVYLVVALAFWAWFRFRPPGDAAAKPVSGTEVGVGAVTG